MVRRKDRVEQGRGGYRRENEGRLQKEKIVGTAMSEIRHEKLRYLRLALGEIYGHVTRRCWISIIVKSDGRHVK